MNGSFSHRWSLSNYSTKQTLDAPPPPIGFSAGRSSSSIQPPRQAVQLVTPLHFQVGYQYPLIVWLHSAGHNERQIEQVLPHISTRNYVGVGVRATQATDVRGCGYDWQRSAAGLNQAVRSVCEAIDAIAVEVSIHPERIILAGLGSGATMACRIAMACPDQFAGVVRMAGRFPDAGGSLQAFDALRKRQMPMLWQQAINGTDDNPELLQRDIVNAQWMQAQLEIRQYQDDDVMNTVALKDIDRWCFDRIITPSSSADPSASKTCQPSDCVSPHLIKGSDLKMVGFSAN